MRKFAFPAVLLAAGLIAAACGDDGESGGDSVDKDAYVAANEAVFAELPLFPGAELDTTDSAPYYDGDSGDAPVSGYTTHRRYTVPDGVTDQDVVDFYIDTAPDGWTACQDSIGVIDITVTGQPTNTPKGHVLFAQLAHESAFVNVDTTELWAPTYAGAFTITVDHQSGNQPCP